MFRMSWPFHIKPRIQKGQVVFFSGMLQVPTHAGNPRLMEGNMDRRFVPLMACLKVVLGQEPRHDQQNVGQTKSVVLICGLMPQVQTFGPRTMAVLDGPSSWSQSIISGYWLHLAFILMGSWISS